MQPSIVNSSEARLLQLSALNHVHDLLLHGIDEQQQEVEKEKPQAPNHTALDFRVLGERMACFVDSLPQGRYKDSVCDSDGR